MIIGIDASRAARDYKTGTEWYSYYLIEELKKVIPQKIQVVLYASAPLPKNLNQFSDNWREKILFWPPKYLWTQIRLWWELTFHPPDVLLVPAHTIPFLPLRKKIKIVVTVHDVGFKRWPKLYKKIQFWYHDLTMRRIRRRADLIMTDSYFSQKEIVDLYRVAVEKIRVVYLGFDSKNYRPRPGEENSVLAKHQINKPYLLYVGRLEAKKNIGRIIKSFSLVKNHFPELKLVLAGRGGHQYESVTRIIQSLKLEREIILPGYVAAEDLPVLMSQAEILIFPTLYEGFGLPILEAMASGVPVVTSNLDPHREVAASAAFLVNPQDPRVIAEAIKRILTEQQLKESLIEAGLKRVQEFSWERVAQSVADILLGL